MTDTIAFLQSRRSVPPIAMTGPGPGSEVLQTILGIAARVPDHGKLAPWRFIVFEGDARDRAGDIIAATFLRQNPDAAPERVLIERQRLSHAPLVVAVVSRAAPHAKIPEWEQVMSAGAVCMNLVLAANFLGFATVWLTEWFAYDRDVLDRLGLSSSEKIAGFIHIGHAQTRPEDRIRPDMHEIVSYF